VTKRGRIIADIGAEFRNVKNLTLCTVIGDDSGFTVSTVEHLLSALRGLGVDNCTIEVDSKEIPIMDGSAAAFVEAIDEAGLKSLNAPRKYIKVLKPIRVEDGACWGELVPHSSFKLDVEIEFDSHVIGRQRHILELTADAYRSDLSRARTFGFMRDVEKLWKAGLALGAALDNTVAIDENGVLNAEGLRHPQEFVRHKMLDAVGDLALAGYPLLGAYRSVRGGHRLNAHVIRALLDDQSAWAFVQSPALVSRSRDKLSPRSYPTAIAIGE
jgi:UDP-3-O-[3-hydroxymyristoyl] N-acetylglucosamine deacetylase